MPGDVAVLAVPAAQLCVQMSGADFIGTPLEKGDTIVFTIRSGDLIAYGAMTDNITNDPSVQFARRVE